MRTTFYSVYRDTNSSIEQASERLAEFQRQTSSAKRISSPSDDPSGAAAIVKEKAEIATVERYSRSAVSVGSRLNVIDTVLSDIVEKLSAAQTVALSASGSVDQTRRNGAAQELIGIRDALFDDFNQSYNGSQVFSGSSSTTPPYTRTGTTISAYMGNNTEVEVDVDRGRSVSVSFDGSAITQGSDPEDIFATLEDMIAAAQAGDTPVLSAGIAALKRAFDRATTLQSRVGNDTRIVDDEKLRLDELRRASTARLSKVEDVNMVDAITGMTQAETAYRAALGAASYR